MKTKIDAAKFANYQDVIWLFQTEIKNYPIKKILKNKKMYLVFAKSFKT